MNEIMKHELDLAHQMMQKVDFFDVYNSIRIKKFTIKDIGVTHRWITHWHDKGLLLDDHASGKWRKFDLVEYVWLKMIICMRDFNLPLESIKKVKDEIMCEASVAETIEMQPIIPDTIKELYPNLENVDELLKLPEVKKEFEQRKMNLFELVIMDIIYLKTNISILVNREGKCAVLKNTLLEYYNDMPEFIEFIRKSFLSISLTEILIDFIIEKDMQLVSGKLNVLTPDEAKVIETIRREKVKSVKIRFNEKGKPEMIEVTRDESSDPAKPLANMIMNRGYHDIRVVVADGKIVKCENTRKQKIN